MLSLHRDQRGVASAVLIVSMLFILAMLALVIDGGNLFAQRRSIVNTADAAALAAAEAYARQENGAICGSVDGPAQAAADQAASANNSSATRIFYRCPWNGKAGTVRVGYQAAVPGLFSGSKVVSTGATAIFGAALGGSGLLPIELDGSIVQGACGVPNPSPGQPCIFWFDNNNASSQWGFMNLCSQDAANQGLCGPNQVGWDVPASKQCPNTGSLPQTVISSGVSWVLTMEPAPPTYVCIDSGFQSTSWKQIQVGRIGIFPVSEGTIIKNNNPDKYEIIGFTALKVLFVGQGNKSATIAACGNPPAWVSAPSNAVCIKAQWIGPQEIPGPICTTCPILGVYAIRLNG